MSNFETPLRHRFQHQPFAPDVCGTCGWPLMCPHHHVAPPTARRMELWDGVSIRQRLATHWATWMCLAFVAGLAALGEDTWAAAWFVVTIIQANFTDLFELMRRERSAK